MATEDNGRDVGNGHVEFLSNKGAEARGVEDAGHADDAVFREARDHEGDLRHGVEGVGDEDQDRVGRKLDDLFGDRLDDVVVRDQEVVAGHSGLAGDACGDDDNVRVRGGGVVVGSGDGDVKAFHGSGLEQIEAFALGDAFGEIDQDDIAQFLFGGPDGTIRADVAGTYYCDFLTQVNTVLSGVSGVGADEGKNPPVYKPVPVYRQFRAYSSACGLGGYLGLRSALGMMTTAGLTRPSRSRAIARTSVAALNFFGLRGFEGMGEACLILPYSGGRGVQLVCQRSRRFTEF